MISCSKVTDILCYSLTRTSSDNVIRVTQIDFSSLISIKYSTVTSNSYTTSEIYTVNDGEVLEFSNKLSFTRLHTIYRYNFTSDSFAWAVLSPILSKYFDPYFSLFSYFYCKLVSVMYSFINYNFKYSC